jgi:hypothetical protein
MTILKDEFGQDASSATSRPVTTDAKAKKSKYGIGDITRD